MYNTSNYINCPQLYYYPIQMNYDTNIYSQPTFFTYQNQCYQNWNQISTYEIVQPNILSQMNFNPTNLDEIEKSTCSITDQRNVQIEIKNDSKIEKKKHSIFKYPKKNAQSNIINQVFSFLSLKSKSQILVKKSLIRQQKVQRFYQILKQLKKQNKKYINRCYIKQLVTLQPHHPIISLLQKPNTSKSNLTLSKQQFSHTIRTLVLYYLRCKCICTVVTSRKLDKETMKEHLYRRRQVEEYFIHEMAQSKNRPQQN